jgi:hypothetical protein
MNLTPADKALAAGFSGGPEAHGLLTFDLSGTDASGLKWEFMVAARTSCDAVADGVARGLNGVQAVLHEPERTAEEGRARFPGRLHPMCFMDAYRGWMDAKAEARAAMPEGVKQSIRDAEQALAIEHDWALVAQMSRPDPLEQAHRAAQGGQPWLM